MKFASHSTTPVHASGDICKTTEQAAHRAPRTGRARFKIGAAATCLFAAMLSAAVSAEDFYLAAPQAPKIPNATFKVTSYGGVGDGKTMNTEAFRKAIEACTKAGGGRVIVTTGTFVSGPIKLASRMALVIEKGAVIQASDKFSDFG